MIPVDKAHLRVAADTDEGRTGKNNEDNFAISAFQISEKDNTPVLFAMVADGIGGHQAGEVASKIAVEMISEAIARSDASQPTAIMEAAILQAGQTVLVQSEADEAKKGMGTTVTSAWIIDNKLYGANVGNSRMYLLRGNRLIQISIDHTWVQEAVDVGALTSDQAREHPHANIIRRYLGSKKKMEVDLRLRLRSDESDTASLNNQGMRLRPDDRLVLCSDGLNDMIVDDLIFKIVSEENADIAVKKLIDAANEAGGKDNITVIVIDMPEFKPGEKQAQKTETKWAVGLGLTAFFLVFVALVLTLVFYFTGGVDTFFPTDTPIAAPTETSAPTWTPRPADDDAIVSTPVGMYTYTPETGDGN